MTTHTTPTSGAADLPEALYADAVKFAKERASISYVQRKCRCSYNKAERMLEQMVADGIIQTYNGRKDAALTAQAISEAPDHVADLGNMVERAISAEPAAHVQNPAENEHIADDMSKNEMGSNTAYASHGQAPAQPDAPIDVRAVLGPLLNEFGERQWQSGAGVSHKSLEDAFEAVIDAVERFAKPTPSPQAAQQAPAGASAEPYGWLYDWTHSSATGRADTTYTGFTKDEAHARKHDNCLAIFAAPQPAPSADSVLEDAARYRWLRDESWAGYNSGNGTPNVYTIDGAGNRKMQLAEDAMDSAVDAARAAQKEGEKP